MTYQWSEGCDKAFQQLKTEVAEAVMLSSPKGNGDFVIMTDASSRGIGAVLIQIQDGHREFWNSPPESSRRLK